MKALKLSALCVIPFLVSCQQLSGQSDLHWVQVDESRVRDAVKKMIIQHNTKDDELRAEYDLAQQNRERFRRERDELVSQENTRCYHTYEPDRVMPPVHAPPAPAVIGSDIGRKPAERKPFDICMDAVKSIEAIKNISEKLDQLEAASKNKERYEREMGRLADDVATESIQAFSRQSGYDLVLKRQNSGSIIYIKNKLAIDATEAVIDFIERSKPDLAVKYYAEGNSP